ncbi:MAG: hypothetical protein V5A64_03185 [Candidatus Thermoplasmatota archaeon]
MKNKIITVFLITVFFGAIISPTFLVQPATSSNNICENSTKKENAKIVVNVKGLNGVDITSNQIGVENVEKITENLRKLNTAIKKDEEKQALELAHQLKKQGVFNTDKVFDLIKNRINPKKFLSEGLAAKIETLKDYNVSNVMAFVSGYSEEGYFGYPLDAAFISLGVLILNLLDIEGLAILGVIGLSLAITHSIPFRVLLPAMSFYFYSGKIDSVGLKGTQSLSSGTMFGFVGIVVNIFIPNKKPSAFCIGFSPLVTSYFPIE